MPAECEIGIDVVSADVEVTEFRGKLEVDGVSSDVSIEGEPVEIDLEVVSGDIELAGKCGDVSIQSVDGDIHINRANGEIDIKSVSGDIEIRAGLVTDLGIESVSGDIFFEGSLSVEGSYTFTVHSGTIELALPEKTGAVFDITTFSGDIRNDFIKMRDRKSGRLPGTEISFEIGSGEADVEIVTFSGDVLIKKK